MRFKDPQQHFQWIKQTATNARHLAHQPLIKLSTYARLCGSENRYDVTEEWKGREPNLWEQLHNAFPAPSALQARVDVANFYANYSGCPQWCVSMDCICFNCTQMQDTYIPYAHQLMEQAILANMPMPGRTAPRRYSDFLLPTICLLHLVW